MAKGYAKELTREYLEYLGIFYVSIDGKVIKRHHSYTGEEITLKQYINNSGYYFVKLHDYERRVEIPKEKRNSGSGDFCIPVHRIVYAWWEKIAHAGMVIDHCDNDKLNNSIYNLKEVSPSYNICKNKVRRVLKCKLNVPREIYQMKWDLYNDFYQKAKKDKDTEAQHKYRTLRAYWEAKLAYYDQQKMLEYFKVDGDDND